MEWIAIVGALVGGFIAGLIVGYRVGFVSGLDQADEIASEMDVERYCGLKGGKTVDKDKSAGGYPATE